MSIIVGKSFCFFPVGLQFLKWQPAVLYETGDEGLSEKLLLRIKLSREIKPRTTQRLLSSDEFFDKVCDIAKSHFYTDLIIYINLLAYNYNHEFVANKHLTCNV